MDRWLNFQLVAKRGQNGRDRSEEREGERQRERERERERKEKEYIDVRHEKCIASYPSIAASPSLYRAESRKKITGLRFFFRFSFRLIEYSCLNPSTRATCDLIKKFRQLCTG